MPSTIANSPRFKFFDANGNPAAYYLLNTYAAGSLTPKTTWKNQDQSTANTNPITLDANGECLLWLDAAQEYKFILTTPLGAVVSTTDDISGGYSEVLSALSSSSGASSIGFDSSIDYAAGTVGHELERLGDPYSVNWKDTQTGAINVSVGNKLMEIASPKDWGHTIDPGATTYPYNPDIPVELLRGTDSEKFALTLAKTLSFTDYPNFKLSDRAKTAFIKGSVKITIVGDSISAGADNWRSNAYATLLKTKLKQTFPWVTFTFSNLAIGGMSSTTLISDSYVGAIDRASYVSGSNFWFPQSPGGVNGNDIVAPTGYALLDEEYWPTGSVSGKTWKQHIVDSAPDIIVWAFGMNDGTDYETFLYNYETFQTYIKTQMASSVPWFVLVSCFLADKIPPNGQPHATWQIPAQCMADQMKYVAQRDSYGLIDANAVFSLLRDGIRHDYAPYKHEFNWRYATDPAAWLYQAGFAYSAGPSAAIGTGMATRRIATRDIDFSGTFQVSAFLGGNFVGRIMYRGNSDTPGLLTGYAVDLVINSSSQIATVNLYWKSTLIATANYDMGGLPPVGHTVAFKVKCYGARHEVWLTSLLLLEVDHWHSFYRGPVQIGIPQGVGSVSGLGLSYTGVNTEGPVDFDRKWLLGTPVYDTGGVFQAYSDFITNPDSMGGNVVNHPTAWGHNTFYGFGVMKFVDELKQRVNEKIEIIKTASALFTVSAAANTPQVVSTLSQIAFKVRKATKMRVSVNLSFSVGSQTAFVQAGIFIDGAWGPASYLPMSSQIGGAGMRNAQLVFDVDFSAGSHTIDLGAVRNTTEEVYQIGEAGTKYSVSVTEIA